MALAFVLVAGSVILMRSFAHVMGVAPGFAVEDRLTVELSLPSASYPDDATRARGNQEILERIRTVPGVRAAGLINHIPLGGGAFSGGFETLESGPDIARTADYRVASAGYFDAMGNPLAEGRTFGRPTIAVGGMSP